MLLFIKKECLLQEGLTIVVLRYVYFKIFYHDMSFIWAMSILVLNTFVKSHLLNVHTQLLVGLEVLFSSKPSSEARLCQGL